MVVIFFNLGLVLAFILLVSIVFINASTKFVLAILGVICILFLIKDIIQDLYFALYKYKNNVLIVIISFALDIARIAFFYKLIPVSYTHLRAHETGRNLVCRLLLEKKKKKTTNKELND